jgi:hypothetical protein
MRDAAPQTDALLMSSRDAARSLAISERTLWSITHPRGSLTPVRIGSRCLYSPDALREWIATQTATPST